MAASRLRSQARAAPARDRSEVLDRVARSAAAGSPYALELLLAFVTELDLTGPAVSRVVGGIPALRDDVEQEVLVAVARSIHRFRSEARFTTWLYRVAHDVAVTQARRLRPTAELGPDQPGDWPGGGHERRLSSLVAERAVVEAAIESLPPRFRIAVRLRDLEGLSYAEIAEQLGLEVNTVRSRLFRGRALLARHLP